MAGRSRSCGPILVVDGDEQDRSFLARVLSDAGFDVSEAATGEDALRAARGERPGAVVLETHLPGLSGYEVCQELREQFAEELPIMFLSRERTEPSDRAAGLLVGADDYLVKPFAPDEFLARLRALMRRIPRAPPPPFAAPPARRLTRRELEVLRLLADGLEPHEIAERLVISPKTVAGHIEQILKKLDVHSRAAAVALAYREHLVES